MMDAGSSMTELIKLLSVSMPRSGHHATTMVLEGLLREQFAYCEYYNPPSCCRKIPCVKTAEYRAAGALVFMQKTHDHDLTNPIPGSVEGILVQVREPVARALSNYELDLKTVGPRHSRAYLEFKLGQEAAYSDAFFKKWCSLKDRRVLVVRYEDLVSDPVTYFRSIFESFFIPQDYFDEAAIDRIRGRSSAGNFTFRQRDPSGSKYYDAELFCYYAGLVAPSAATAGYADPGSRLSKRAYPTTKLSFAAFAAMIQKNYQGAFDAFTDYLALPNAHFCGLIRRAHILRLLGQNAEAERDLKRLLEIDDSFEPAYFALSELRAIGGDLTLARESLELCLAKSSNPVKAYRQMKQRFSHRPQLIPKYTQKTVSKEEIIAAFRYILGREPKSERVVSKYQALESVSALRTKLISSAEFASAYRRITRGK